MKVKFIDDKHVKLREATRRYRARQRGELVPLLRAVSVFYPEGQCNRDRVKFSCVSCAKECETRRGRIKVSGNQCRACAFRTSAQERIAETGFAFSKETRSKMSAAKKGKPGLTKGVKRSPESMAPAWAAAKLIPSERRYRPKPRLDPAVKILRQKVRQCCGNMIKRIIKIKKSYKKTLRTFEYLGYTKADFISHIESQFKPGMSWDNWGHYQGKWNVDHIKPIAAFLNEGITDLSIINALSNLQPLWAKDNFKKQASWPAKLSA